MSRRVVMILDRMASCRAQLLCVMRVRPGNNLSAIIAPPLSAPCAYSNARGHQHVDTHSTHRRRGSAVTGSFARPLMSRAARAEHATDCMDNSSRA